MFVYIQLRFQYFFDNYFSERVHNLNDSKRFNEGRKINLSLSCLSTVIGKLGELYITFVCFNFSVSVDVVWKRLIRYPCIP